nr:MAG TPA: helix-turn-helix domain protein [Caudoviricetes sp.]
MSERIKRIRKMLDLTQQEFADRIGIKRNTIANYESGRNEPVDSVISLICREYGVNEAWLRTGEGEMFTPNPETELDALKERYSLSQAECSLIDVFVNMNEKDRKTVLDFVVHAADSIRENDLFFGVPDTPEELEAKYPPVRAIKKDVG